MKILILNYRDRRHPMAGGAENHLHRIFGGLATGGHQILLWVPSFPGALDREVLDGMQVIRSGNDLTFNLHVLFGLRKRILEFAPDLILEDINKLPFYTPLLTRIPVCVQLHHLWGLSIFREAFFPVALLVWLHERLIPLVYRRCSFAVVSSSTQQELLAMGISTRRIRVIHNGAELEWISQNSLPKKGDYFLWLGRLRRYKGIYIAMRAFAVFARENPGTRLIFAGAGPEEKKMREQIRKLGLEERIEVLGSVSHEKKRELLQGALALIQSSYKEGWGLTVIEAGACGTIALASRVAGLKDSVVDGKTGFLFPVGNIQALAHLLVQVVQNDQMRTTMEVEAQKWARTFSWEKATQESSKWLHAELAKKSGVGV